MFPPPHAIKRPRSPWGRRFAPPPRRPRRPRAVDPPTPESSGMAPEPRSGPSVIARWVSRPTPDGFTGYMNLLGALPRRRSGPMHIPSTGLLTKKRGSQVTNRGQLRWYFFTCTVLCALPYQRSGCSDKFRCKFRISHFFVPTV